MAKKRLKSSPARVAKGKTGKRSNGTERAAKKKKSASNGVLAGPWKPLLDMYEELSALQFSTEEQYAKAAELLWGDLRELPFDIVGNHTIIIPAEATRCFDGLEFTETEVLSPNDLPADELAALRRECGPY